MDKEKYKNTSNDFVFLALKVTEGEKGIFL